MKNPINMITSLIILSLLFLAIGCEGPEGPAGIQGPAGADGADGADITEAVCLTCHNNDALIEKRFELNQHDHATFPNSLSRGGRSSCGRCHSHENFVFYWDTDTTYNLSSVTGLQCKSCHTLHDNEEVDDFSFATRVDGDVPFLTGGTETFAAESPSNLCLACHQPRRTYEDYDETPSDASDAVSLTSSHAGPHYGITGSFIFGKGADGRNGTVSLDQGPGAHASVGCVDCHMGEDRIHKFHPEVETCAGCHSGAEDFDMNGAPTMMHDAIHAIELEFVTLGALSTTDSVSFSQTASSSSPTVLTGAQFSAFWNYQVLHGDHGSIYHNPPYAKAIINNIEENLGMTQTSW